jgi:hypothetical protein
MTFLPKLFKLKELIAQAEAASGKQYGNRFKVVHPTCSRPAGLAFKDSADEEIKAAVCRAWVDGMGVDE